jgi:hypothetical protein
MRIPRATSTAVPGDVGIPSAGGRMPLNDPANAGLREVSSAFGKMGDQVEARFDQRRKEQVAMGTASAIANLRKFESDKILPMFSLGGAQAVGDLTNPDESPGVYSRGTKAYDEEIERISSNITDPEISAAFRLRASTVRAGGLEGLARHEAKEHQVLKKNTYDATFAEVNQSVAANYADTALINASIKELDNLADEMFPGLDMTATKMAHKEALLATALARTVEVNPEVALVRLRAWQGDLGDKYDQLRKPIESAALYERVKREHPDDFDAQYDVALGSSFEGDVKRAVGSWVRASERDKEQREEKAKKDRRIAGYNGFWGAMREGDTVSAVKSITAMSDDDFTQQEKAQLEAAVQTGMKANNELAEKSLRVAIRTGQIKDMQEIYSSDVLQQLDVAALGRLETVMAQEQADPSGYGTAQSTLLARFDRVYKDTPLYQLKPKYFGEILDDVEKAEKDKGRRLTTREYLDIGNNLLDMKAEEHPWMIFGVDTGITTDSQGREFDKRMERQAEESKAGSQKKDVPSQAEALVDQIPADVRSKIVEAMRQRGRPAYATDIWKMYEHYHPDDARALAERGT